MRKSAALLFMLLWTAPVFAQDSMPDNGTTWREFARIGRLFYVKGYMDGKLQTMQEVPNAFSGLVGKSGHWVYYRDNGITPSPVEIESGVNAFYSVSENLPVCIASAVNFEWLSLAGHPYEKGYLEVIRKVDGQKGCNPLPGLGQYVEQLAADEEAAKAHPKKP